jgi:hypothetical protein
MDQGNPQVWDPDRKTAALGSVLKWSSKLAVPNLYLSKMATKQHASHLRTPRSIGVYSFKVSYAARHDRKERDGENALRRK